MTPAERLQVARRILRSIDEERARKVRADVLGQSWSTDEGMLARLVEDADTLARAVVGEEGRP